MNSVHYTRFHAWPRGLPSNVLLDEGLDCDGDVDLNDLAELLGAYGCC